MRPRFSRIGGFVDSVADRKIGPVQSFAAGDVDDVRIRRRDCNGADRLRGFVIEDGIPCAAVVVRLPHSAVHLSHVKHVGLAGHAGGGAGTSAAKGANHPPMQFMISAFGNLRPGCGGEKRHHTRKQKNNGCRRGYTGAAHEWKRAIFCVRLYMYVHLSPSGVKRQTS